MQKFLIVTVVILIVTGCTKTTKNKTNKVIFPETPTSLQKLTVSGTNIIVAENSNIIKLKGISIAGGVWQHGGQPSSTVSYCTTEADIQNVKNWGVNAITFYMDWTWFQNDTGWTFMNQVLNWCRKYNVYIIPSLVYYPQGGFRGGDGFFNSPSAKTELKAFWSKFAQNFAGREEIAGYDLLNEPESSTLTTDDVKAYITELIDTVRQIDPVTTIYVESIYGGWYNLFKVERPNLVYNIHYYDPTYFNSQEWPWIHEGSIPGDLSYPGNNIQNIQPITSIYLPTAPAGTYNWTKIVQTDTVPANAEFLYYKLFSNGDLGATLYFDKIEYSDSSGSYLTTNGSFETKNEVSDNPLYFEKWQQSAGTLARTSEEAYDGSYSIKISGCTGWGHFGNYSEVYWCGDTAAIHVTPGEVITVSYWVKGINVTANQNGILLWYAKPNTIYVDKSYLENSLDNYLTSFSTANNVPIFIGEFTSSLVGKRPDILNFINDEIDCFNARGYSWTYYVYRENWTGTKRYLGIYNGPEGATATGGNCTFYQDVIDLLKTKY